MSTAAMALPSWRVRRRRRVTDTVMVVLLAGATAIALGLLLLILGYVIVNGLPALNFAFFTERPKPFGVEGGGVGPAILGTLIVSGVAGLIAIPIGIAAAIFVTELRPGRWGGIVRFAAELIAGLPSIAVGVFVWSFLVRGLLGKYSAIAGAVALAIIMIPIVARTTEEVLRLVPGSLREAALARAAGETAPLLLTALGNLFFSTDLLRPIAALPLQIYQYAASPYDDWHAKAWGASLILVAVIAVVSFALRAFAPRASR